MEGRLVVLDTNCLIQILGIHSKYRFLWSEFMACKYTLCISNEILHEYEEILSQKASPLVAEMFMAVLARSKNVIRKDPYFQFNLIKTDKDDNKFEGYFLKEIPLKLPKELSKKDLWVKAFNFGF